MDKKKTIQTLLKSGFLASPKILNELDETNINDYIKNSKSLVIEPDKQNIPIVSFRKRRTKNKLTIQDFVKYYNEIYEYLKNILLKKTNATSINKIKNISSEVTVIGMVKDMVPQGFVLEDPTGQITVVTNSQPDINNVVAVTGLVRENKLFKKEIIFPEIPLPKDIPKLEMTLLLTTNKDTTNNKADVIITTNYENKNKNTFKIPANPSWADISKGGKITLLTYKPDEPIEELNIFNYLKTRILSSKNINPNTQTLIDTIPNIFWIIQEKEWAKNFKGIIIISSANTISVDLNTHKIQFV